MKTTKGETMKIYRVEIPAIKIIDVEAQSERSAL